MNIDHTINNVLFQTYRNYERDEIKMSIKRIVQNSILNLTKITVAILLTLFLANLALLV
ncbi:MAG: hypothetical protein ABIA97_02020 [Candidatus Omnitrophota bacterium]